MAYGIEEHRGNHTEYTEEMGSFGDPLFLRVPLCNKDYNRHVSLSFLTAPLSH
jgi:hypothetical protein